MMRKITTLVGMVALLALLAPAAGSAGLIGQWRFDDGSGSSAADSSGNGNGGAVSGATWITGKRGGALSFDGAGGQVRVPSASVLEPASGVTAQAWVRRSGGPGRFRYVIAKGTDSCIAASYGLYSGDDGGLAFYVSSALGFDATISPSAGSAAWDGAWHLATGTFDGSMVRLYLDGVEVGSGAPRLSGGITYAMPDGNDLFLGHYDGCVDHDFGGDVDDVKLFDRALTADEVKAQYAYAWQGFFAPVDNAPTINSVKAGSAVPVKFSLTGYQGMDILAAGSPSSRTVTCSTSAPVDAVETTSTAGSSSLSYDATSDRYNYVWKTDKAWVGTCRQLSVELVDGSVHTATFKFSK